MITIFRDWRVTVYGLLSWIIPFFGSFVFFDPTGGLAIPLPLFKSLMVVMGTASGIVLLAIVFRRVKPTALSGLTIGVYWLILNWVLDLIFLLPLSGTSVTEYAYDIGLRYLSLPLIAVGMGWVAERSAKAKTR